MSRYGLLPGEAFEVLSGLARSQERAIEEFARSVVESGGRLDGELNNIPEASATDGQQPAVATRPIVAELVIEAPSAAAAFVLAGTHADYGASAQLEDGTWRVAVRRCSVSREGVAGALSRVTLWLAEYGCATASVTLNGETYLLDGSTNGAGHQA